MKTSEVLRKAGDVLRERGWSQGALEREGRYCAVGALQRVENGSAGCAVSEDDGSAFAALALVVDTYPSYYNDAPGRTAAEVMIALDAAYVVALQEEGIEPGDVL